MLYSFECCGVFCEHLGLPCGSIFTEVVCMDDRRIVFNTYLNLMHF